MTLILPLPPKIAELTLQRSPIAKINHPHPDNPAGKCSPEKREILKQSLQNDYFDPIIWNERNGKLVSGHLRCELLVELAYTEVDHITVNYDEPTHLARMKAANEHSRKPSKEGLELLLGKLRANPVHPALAMLASLEKTHKKQKTVKKRKPGAFELIVVCTSETELEAAQSLLRANGYTVTKP
jgi:hypothetical protein